MAQDDELIAKIHTEELALDEYYDLLGPILAKRFQGASPYLVERAVALAAAFDTGASFALSFGIAKFQLCQVIAVVLRDVTGVVATDQLFGKSQS